MGLFGSSFGQPDPQGYMMNIGQPQQPQNAWQMAMQPTQQQAAQSFQQQYGQPIGNMQAQALPVDPRAAQATKPGFFGKGGMGGKIAMGALGGIADGFAVHGGFRPGYSDGIDRQREYQQRLQELQAEREARMQERQQSAEQGFETWKQQQQWALEHPDPTAIQRNTEYIASLPEDDPRRAIATQQTTGYGYSPEVMASKLAQQQELINARLAAQVAAKQAPSYAATHPKPGGAPKYKIVNGKVMKWVP